MKTGILLLNIGSPHSYDTKDVAQYLTQFLLDPQVIDKPFFMRQLLVRGVIVPSRKQASSLAYRSIWTEQGSPLLVNSFSLQEKLQETLGNNYLVSVGMRYGSPSIEQALDTFKKNTIQSLIMVPLFPQYAAATTGSALKEVMRHLKSWKTAPQIRYIHQFHDHPAYINAFAARAHSYRLSDYDRILFSFHGLPQRQMIKSSPHYQNDCTETARLIANKLNLTAEQHLVTFQSRLGKEPWCQPYTSETVQALGRAGCKKILVFSPAFVADCLETLYEIKIELQTEFRHAGGEQIDLVESLNSSPEWVEGLKKIILGYDGTPHSNFSCNRLSL
jgi:ferrochelatase